MNNTKLVKEKEELNNLLILEKEILLNLSSFKIEDLLDLQEKKHKLLKEIAKPMEQNKDLYTQKDLIKVSTKLLNNKKLLGLKIQHLKTINNLLFKLNT